MSFDTDQFLAGMQPYPAGLTVPPMDKIPTHGGEFGSCGPVLFLYRAHAQAYDPYGEGDSGYLCVRFHFTRYRAVRFTLCGAWVTDAPYWLDAPKLRWVSLAGGKGKRLGYLSKADAIESLRHRNRRHVQILEWHLASAKQVYDVLNPKENP